MSVGIVSGTLFPEGRRELMPRATKDAPVKSAAKASAKSGKAAAKASGAGKATKATSKAAKSGGRKAASKGKKVTLDKFLEGQLAMLQDDKASYLRQAETLQAEADSLTEDREPGDVQFDEESGEGDTLAVERERDLALSAQARAAVEQIDTAIAKIHDGTYGECENCGTKIPKERLKALPYASLCVKCKSGGLGLR
jgi:RNA polymerase-binding protein DksA